MKNFTTNLFNWLEPLCGAWRRDGELFSRLALAAEQQAVVKPTPSDGAPRAELEHSHSIGHPAPRPCLPLLFTIYHVFSDPTGDFYASRIVIFSGLIRGRFRLT